MVDFKRLRTRVSETKTNPLEIYDSLDRTSDKGPLRPAQQYILTEWYENHRKNKDVIVKLHTGEGKTLIGLLILQSRINEKQGPALYLCPNNYLVRQTCIQATQFGIPHCEIETGLPAEFLDGRSEMVKIFQTTPGGF